MRRSRRKLCDCSISFCSRSPIFAQDLEELAYLSGDTEGKSDLLASVVWMRKDARGLLLAIVNRIALIVSYQ